MEQRIKSGSLELGTFDRQQSLFADSLFPTPHYRASVIGAGGNSWKTASPSPIVPGLLQDMDTASYVPWSHNDHYDPYQFLNCVLSHTLTRKPTDDMNYDGETILQGLVSNILDEASSWQSYAERNQPASCQSMMAGDHDSFCRRDSPNMFEQTFAMLHEESLAEQWKICSPTLSTQSTPAMLIQKLPEGKFSLMQQEENGVVRKQRFQHEAFQNYLQEQVKQPELFSAAINLPNHYQNKVTPHGGSMNQYPMHHILQSQIQDKFKPHMPREKKMLHMPGNLGESFYTRPLMNTERRQVFPQKPWFDQQGGLQSQKLNRESIRGNAGNSERFIPPVSPESDFRGHHIIPSNYSLRSTVSNRKAAPGKDFREMMTRNAESPYHGRTATLAMNQEGPATQLLVYMDECNEQWKRLSMEIKMTETTLAKVFGGKWTAARKSTIIPKTQPNPTRVDHLIVKLLTEEGELVSLLYRMESLCNTPININIHAVLNTYHEAICSIQARSRQIAIMCKQQQRAHVTDGQDPVVLTVKDLAATTRKLRTALWCAVQLMLPLPVREQDDHVNRKGCTSPLKGNSFRF